jgi:hypothetical protein
MAKDVNDRSSSGTEDEKKVVVEKLRSLRNITIGYRK